MTKKYSLLCGHQINQVERIDTKKSTCQCKHARKTLQKDPNQSDILRSPKTAVSEIYSFVCNTELHFICTFQRVVETVIEQGCFQALLYI